jgi:hypothetical protein
MLVMNLVHHNRNLGNGFLCAFQSLLSDNAVFIVLLIRQRPESLRSILIRSQNSFRCRFWGFYDKSKNEAIGI